MSGAPLRICVVGDELAAGAGDPRALGWLGRVLARTDFPEPPLVMPLTRPGETTSELEQRWEAECFPRFSAGADNRLIVGVGTGDVSAGVTPARARLDLANIVDRATSRRIRSLVVGPPPLAGVEPQGLRALTRALAQVCARRQVPYVETFRPLESHDQWNEDMAAAALTRADGSVLPGQAGYALLAWLVLHEGWYQWIGADPRA